MSSQTLYIPPRPYSLRTRPSRRRPPRFPPSLCLFLSSTPRRPPTLAQRLGRLRFYRPTHTHILVLLFAAALLAGLTRTVRILFFHGLTHPHHVQPNGSHGTNAHRLQHTSNHTLAFETLVSQSSHVHQSRSKHPQAHPSKPSSHTRHYPRPPHLLNHHEKADSTHELPASSPSPSLPSHDFSHLPHPRWFHHRLLSKFLPLRSSSRDIRLVLLQNAVFCPVRNRFLLPAKPRYPAFLRRHAIAQVVAWNAHNLRESSKQKVIHIKGTTVLWRGRAFDEQHAHLLRSLLPVRAVIDQLENTPLGRDIKLAAEGFHGNGKKDRAVQKLQEYFLGDVPESNRIALRDLHPNLLHFEHVVSLGSEFEGRSLRSSFDKVKSLIEEEEGFSLPGPLSRSCKEESANRRTIWVLDRQLARGGASSVANMAEVVTGVNHALLHMGLAESVELRTMQSPDVACGRGTAREGCFATACGGEVRGCEREGRAGRTVQAFNNMTLLVAVAGQALDGVAYMPEGSVVLEVVPHGAKADESRKDMARVGGVRIYQLRNARDKRLERRLHERFGDVAQTERSCWMDAECQAARESVGTRVDVHHLKMLLGIVLRDWRKRCMP